MLSKHTRVRHFCVMACNLNYKVIQVNSCIPFASDYMSILPDLMLCCCTIVSINASHPRINGLLYSRHWQCGSMISALRKWYHHCQRQGKQVLRIYDLKLHGAGFSLAQGIINSQIEYRRQEIIVSTIYPIIGHAMSMPCVPVMQLGGLAPACPTIRATYITRAFWASGSNPTSR